MTPLTVCPAPLKSPAPSQPGDITLAAGPLMVGRSEDCQIVLRHLSVSRRHAVLETNGVAWEVRDLESRYGTFVNGARISRKKLEVGDSVRFGSVPPYRFDGNALRASPDAVGIALRLRDVSVIRRVNGRDKALVSNLHLEIPAGGFIGILGPSGAGKTVLMDCLSSNQPPSQGTITFDDDRPLEDHREYFRSKAGVITQEDIVFPDLTVEENLQLAARIRLPQSHHNDIPSRVQAALNDVDLEEHRRKLVSKLSGGQRKRVSVAIELLSQPRLLLLDEPTSGLDPGRQAMLMETLRRLSRRGVTVVCVTHTLDTMNFFDAVAVLGIVNGVSTVAYQGPPKELLSAFGAATQADLFDQLSQLAADRLEQGTGANAWEVTAAPSSGSAAPACRAAQEAASWRAQAGVVSRRSLLSLWRDKSARYLAMAQPPILSVLIALSQRDRHSVYAHTFLVLMAVWLGMTLTVREFVRERPLYRRDRLAGLRPTAYLAGKILFAMPVTFGQAALFVGVFRWMASLVTDDGLAAEIARVPVMSEFGLFWMTTFGGGILGLILSTLSRSERTAIGLLPLVLLPQFLFSRISSGDAMLPWYEPSPYCPIASFYTSYHEQYQVSLEERLVFAEAFVLPRQKKDDVAPILAKIARELRPSPSPHLHPEAHVTAKTLLATVSLLALTRPATAAIDLRAVDPDGIPPYWFGIEVVYLTSLLLVYAIFLLTTFLWKERCWTGAR